MLVGEAKLSGVAKVTLPEMTELVMEMVAFPEEVWRVRFPVEMGSKARGDSMVSEPRVMGAEMEISPAAVLVKVAESSMALGMFGLVDQLADVNQSPPFGDVQVAEVAKAGEAQARRCGEGEFGMVAMSAQEGHLKSHSRF